MRGKRSPPADPWSPDAHRVAARTAPRGTFSDVNSPQARPQAVHERFVSSRAAAVRGWPRDQGLKGTGKEFDCYPGETIKIMALYDPTSNERELVSTKKSDDFPDAAE